MRSKIGNRERLSHILESIDYIQRSIKGVNLDDFEKDFILHTAVVKWEEIIGEACYHITTDLKEKHPEVDWKRIQGMRHVLVHEYAGIDIIVVWKVAESLDELKEKILNILSEFE